MANIVSSGSNAASSGRINTCKYSAEEINQIQKYPQATLAFAINHSNLFKCQLAIALGANVTKYIHFHQKIDHDKPLDYAQEIYNNTQTDDAKSILDLIANTIAAGKVKPSIKNVHFADEDKLCMIQEIPNKEEIAALKIQNFWREKKYIPTRTNRSVKEQILSKATAKYAEKFDHQFLYSHESNEEPSALNI